MKRFLNTEQASEYMSIPEGSLANYRSKGEGPRYYKHGRKVHYDIKDLDSWMMGDDDAVQNNS